jgi:hypothetical protein
MSALERRCRFLLRAWPWRDRQERGEEIVGTMLDLAGPGRSWPSLGMALNIVVGGWRARRRRRPPFTTRLLYRLGGPLDYRWHQWLLDDLLTPGWRRRHVARSLGSYLRWVVPFGIFAFESRALGRLVVAGCAVVNLALTSVLANRRRRRDLRRRGYSIDVATKRVESHLAWVSRVRVVPNVRVSPIVLTMSVPLIATGVIALAYWRPGARSDPFRRQAELTLFALLAPFIVVGSFLVIAGLHTVCRRARRLTPGIAGPPTPAWVLVTYGTRAAAVLLTVATVHNGLLGLPDAAGLTIGVAGLALGFVGLVIRANERRIGRAIGLWELCPALGPVVKLRVNGFSGFGG